MDNEFAVEGHATLAELVTKIQQGEKLRLTRGGQTIAVIHPRGRQHDPAEAKAAMERIVGRGQQMRLNGLSIRSLIDQGRKY